MLEREKVKTGIFEMLQRNTWKDIDKERHRFQPVLNDALSLLKEQEAKSIVYTDNPYTGLPVAHCPKCGKFVSQFYPITTEETRYCPWCGQAVKFDDY